MDTNQPSPISQVPSSAEPQIVAPAPLPKLPTQPEKSLPAPHSTSWGALIGIIIIVALLIVGALYFWGAKLEQMDSQNLSANRESSK